MAIVAFNAPWHMSVRNGYTGTTATTMNLATEESFTVGQIFWKGGTSGATKVLSAAGGGRILWNAGSSTFANAGTTLRVGAQDVTAAGLNDGTFDVHKDLVGATDTITSNTLQNTLMASGSKTFSYGGLSAIGMEMTARAGADSVGVDRVNQGSGLASLAGSSPYSVHLGAKAQSVCCFTIIFDDGTYGWLMNGALLWNTTITAVGAIPTNGILFNSTDSPDEYVMACSLPFQARILGAILFIDGVSTSDPFEVIAYLDPFGSPSVIETLAHPSDPDHHVGGGVVGPFTTMLATPYDLPASSVIGFAVRPTSAGDISIGFHNLTSGFDGLKNAQPFSTIKLGGRTDQTGAFVETQAYHLPEFTLLVGGVEAGAAGTLIGSLVNGGKVR
jgi:hypothetical protein